MISHWLEMRLPKCKRIFFISKQNAEKKYLERDDFDFCRKSKSSLSIFPFKAFIYLLNIKNINITGGC
jgi:hypothetical protein